MPSAGNDAPRRKPLRCRLGFHLTFGDSVLRNLGTDTTPVYLVETYESCNDCDWTTRPRVIPPGGDHV